MVPSQLVAFVIWPYLPRLEALWDSVANTIQTGSIISFIVPHEACRLPISQYACAQTWGVYHTHNHCPIQVFHWDTGTDMGCTCVLIYTRITAVSSMCTTGTDMGCTYVLMYTCIIAVCSVFVYHWDTGTDMGVQCERTPHLIVQRKFVSTIHLYYLSILFR